MTGTIDESLWQKEKSATLDQETPGMTAGGVTRRGTNTGTKTGTDPGHDHVTDGGTDTGTDRGTASPPPLQDNNTRRATLLAEDEGEDKYDNLRQWIKEIDEINDDHLDKYCDYLIEAGYKTIKSLQWIDDQELEHVGVIKKGHRKALLRAFKKIEYDPQDLEEAKENPRKDKKRGQTNCDGAAGDENHGDV